MNLKRKADRQREDLRRIVNEMSQNISADKKVSYIPVFGKFTVVDSQSGYTMYMTQRELKSLAYYALRVLNEDER